MPKLKNSNATFLLIFKHCVVVTTDIFGDLWRTLMSDVEKQDLLSSSTNMNHKNSQKSWGLKMSICTLSILIVREKCSVDRSGDQGTLFVLQALSLFLYILSASGKVKASNGSTRLHNPVQLRLCLTSNQGRIYMPNSIIWILWNVQSSRISMGVHMLPSLQLSCLVGIHFVVSGVC